MTGKVKKNHRKTIILLIGIAIALFLAALFQLNSVLRKSETERAYDTLEEWAEQTAATIGYKVDKYYGILESVSVILKNEHLEKEELHRLLKETCGTKALNFVQAGYADVSGNAWCTDDTALSVARTRFFTESIAGRKNISDILTGGEKLLIISVPVYDVEGSVKGVLYGEIKAELLRSDISKEKEEMEQYMHIVRSDGRYIYKQGESIYEGSNFFKDLEKQEPSIRIDRIQGRLEKGMVLKVKLGAEGEEQKYAVLCPTQKYGLYIATIMKKSAITAHVDIYQKDVFFLALKLVLIMAGLMCIYIYYQKDDRRYIARLNKQLLLNEETYRITAKSSDSCIFTYDVETEQIQFLNDKYKDFGLDQAMLSVPVLLKNMEQDNSQICKTVRELGASLRECSPYISRKTFISIYGEKKYLRINMTNIFDSEGMVSRAVGTIEDITNSENNMKKLEKESSFKNTLLADSIGYLVVNVTKDTVLEASQNILGKASLIGGVTYTEMLESFLSKRVETRYWDELTGKMSIEALRRMYEQEDYGNTFEYVCIDNKGDEQWNSCEIHMHEEKTTGEITAYLVYRNINDRKKQQKNLERLAQIDLLTGAFNRMAGTGRIEKILKTAPDKGCVHAFVMVDLDNFKSLNDVFGHMWGDKALFEVAGIMKNHCRSQDVVCRLGGDEFIVFLNNIPKDVVERNVGSLTKKLRIPYEKDDQTIVISGSVGIALMPENGATFKELYEAADGALYKVKNESKGEYYFSRKKL